MSGLGRTLNNWMDEDLKPGKLQRLTVTRIAARPKRLRNPLFRRKSLVMKLRELMDKHRAGVVPGFKIGQKTIRFHPRTVIANLARRAGTVIEKALFPKNLKRRPARSEGRAAFFDKRDFVHYWFCWRQHYCGQYYKFKITADSQG